MHGELTERARRALEALRPESEPGAAIEAVTLEALRSRLRDCLAEIGDFEAKYGRTFEDLAREWASRPSRESHAHAAEIARRGRPVVRPRPAPLRFNPRAG